MESPEIILAVVTTLLGAGLVPITSKIYQRFKKPKLNLITADAYIEKYSDWDLEEFNKLAPSSSYRPSWNIGDIKGSVVIIEFEIINETSQPITVTSIVINDWIFSEKRVSEGMEGYNRDYRIFDIHSRESTDLQNRHIIEPNSTIGFRAEILVKAMTNGVVISKYPTFVPQDMVYEHIIRVMIGNRIKLEKKVRVKVVEDTLYQVPVWSNIMGERYSGYTIPKEVKQLRKQDYERYHRQYQINQIKLRIKDFFSRRKNS